jgi:prolyl oligopeptidase
MTPDYMIIMKKTLLFLFIAFSLSLYCQKNFEYPPAMKSDTSDMYFGTNVPDPYRGLEDINSPQTLNWLSKEALITDQYETGKRSLENGIYEKLMQYGWSASKRLMKRGRYYFHYLIYDEKKPPVLFYQKSFNGTATALIDPEKFKKNKSDVLTIKDFDVSGDNRYIAFSLSKSGADWTTIRVVDLETLEPTGDVIENVKFADLSWKGNGFFYIRCDTVAENIRITAANTNPKLYYHKLRDKVKDDLLVYDPLVEKKDKWFGYSVTYDEKYLILHDYIKQNDTTFEKAVLYSSLDSLPSILFRPFILMPRSSKCEFSVIAHFDNSFLVRTDLDAPTGRILLYNPSEGINHYKVIVPPFKNVLEHASYSDGKILCLYTLRGQFMACVYNSEGKMIKQIRFPQGNSVYGFRVAPGDKETYYYVSSFYFPSVVHRLDLQTMKTELVTNTFIAFDQTLFETKFITYRSFDSTEIPMFLTYKKGLKLKDDNPVLLYGYGGFGVNLTPFFSPGTILWIENGGIFAVPGIRGGGEKGSTWYEEGRRLKKFNSFNDFIAAARYLIDSNYTSHEKLAIEGGSNGGLLVGVAMTQHPELFKAAVSEMGVFDMLRYDKFTIGAQNENEFGISSNAKDFPNLLSYSPLHNLKKGANYPATLVITADNDDRVPPLHSYKFMATLQELGDKSNPYLLKVIKKGGHNGSDLLKQDVETEALKCMFLFKSLNVDPATVY